MTQDPQAPIVPVASSKEAEGDVTFSGLQVPEGLPARFTEGNMLWKKSLENRHRLGVYPQPDKVIELVCEYFQWLNDNPYQEGKLVTYEGNSTLEEIPKLRMPTLEGLCAFVGITRDTWGAWRRGDRRPEMKIVAEWGEQLMRESKLTAAAAGLLNPTIVIRDLGLIDKTQVDGKTTVVINGDEANL